MVAPETWQLSQQRHEAVLHALGQFLPRAVLHFVLSDGGEHGAAPCGQPQETCPAKQIAEFFLSRAIACSGAFKSIYMD